MATAERARCAVWQVHMSQVLQSERLRRTLHFMQTCDTTARDTSCVLVVKEDTLRA